MERVEARRRDGDRHVDDAARAVLAEVQVDLRRVRRLIGELLGATTNRRAEGIVDGSPQER